MADRSIQREVIYDETVAATIAENSHQRYWVADGESRRAAALAQEIARFPQGCLRADRHSVYAQSGLSEMDGLRSEWRISARMVAEEGLVGAARFADGRGQHGDFGEI